MSYSDKASYCKIKTVFQINDSRLFCESHDALKGSPKNFRNDGCFVTKQFVLPFEGDHGIIETCAKINKIV